MRLTDFITLKELVVEYQDWYMSDRIERFGQHVYNTYFSDWEPWPELFYEEDEMTAFALVANKLIEGCEFDNVVDYTGEFLND